jgi:hypothetical protein
VSAGPTVEQLDAIVRRLEVIQSALGITDLAVTPRAPVDPDGFPAHVAAGELIESAWGNATVDTLHLLHSRHALIALGSPSIPGGTLQQASFSTLSDTSWGPGPVFIAPAGTAGFYAFMANITGAPTMIADTYADVTINVKTTGFNNFIPGGKSKITTVGFTDLAPADQVSVSIYNPTGAAAFFTVTLVILRVAW